MSKKPIIPLIQPSTSSSLLLFRHPLLSWLLDTARHRIIFFIICSPILLPLLCISFPLLCLSQIYICLCRRRKRRGDGGGMLEDGVVEEEEEKEMGWLLLQRYLEDQLGLVGSVFDDFDGDDDDNDVDVEGDGGGGGGGGGFDGDESRRPLLSYN